MDSGEVRDGTPTSVKSPFPLFWGGSVQDDGPLPESIWKCVRGAERHAGPGAESHHDLICMASTLHTVATGNMTPCYRVVNGSVRPPLFLLSGYLEFAVNKLRDRGSLSVKTIVTNVQDFIVNVRKGVCGDA